MAYPMPQKSSKPPSQVQSSTAGVPTRVHQPAQAPSSWLRGLVTLIVILIIIGGGIYFFGSTRGIGGGLFSGTKGLTAQWQAVFLTNGQVYFGEVAKVDRSNVYLRNIYYLQVVTQPLQRSAEDGEEVPTDQTEQRLTLIKLGNELHGPEDEMIINRDHVVLMEDLKDDSRVVQAINDYIANRASQ